MRFNLLTAGNANPKTAKRSHRKIVNAVLHLAPADQSGYEVCQFRTPGCTAACLNTAGRGGIPQPGRTDGHLNAIQAARVRKTKLFFEDRDTFMGLLYKDLYRLRDHAAAESALCAVRLNGTSDLPWHRMSKPSIMDEWPDVQFYDYTKRPFDWRTLPPNYRLTLSFSGSNNEECHRHLMDGGNVAAVFHGPMPKWFTFFGPEKFRVIDGDVDDFRFLDPPGCIIGLKAKGKAKHDTTGFVIHI